MSSDRREAVARALYVLRPSLSLLKSHYLSFDAAREDRRIEAIDAEAIADAAILALQPAMQAVRDEARLNALRDARKEVQRFADSAEWSADVEPQWRASYLAGVRLGNHAILVMMNREHEEAIERGEHARADVGE